MSSLNFSFKIVSYFQFIAEIPETTAVESVVSDNESSQSDVSGHGYDKPEPHYVNQHMEKPEYSFLKSEIRKSRSSQVVSHMMTTIHLVFTKSCIKTAIICMFMQCLFRNSIMRKWRIQDMTFLNRVNSRRNG